MYRTIRHLLSAFLLVCAAIHVYGLFVHITNEGTLSHIIHTLSYLLCFVAVLFLHKKSRLAYAVGAIYPFIYHLNCATQSAIYEHKFNTICWLVTVVLPLGGWWLIRSTSVSPSDE